LQSIEIRDDNRSETAILAPQETQAISPATTSIDDNTQESPQILNVSNPNISQHERQRRITTRMQESQEQCTKKFVAYLAYYEVLHKDDYQIQEDMSDPC
jgi:hypothetical protein